MKSFVKVRFSWSAVVAALAVILVVLAVLEYRWNKDVSEAASVRMRASLQASLMAYRQDLYRELADICMPLQLVPAVNEHDRWPQYARQVAAAQRTAALPHLVANVFVWSTRGDNSYQLHRMNSATGHFELTQWPASLEPLHEGLRAISPEVEAIIPRPRRRIRRRILAPQTCAAARPVRVLRGHLRKAFPRLPMR